MTRSKKSNNALRIGIRHVRGFVTDVRDVRRSRAKTRHDVKLARRIEEEAQYNAAVRLRTEEILDEVK